MTRARAGISCGTLGNLHLRCDFFGPPCGEGLLYNLNILDGLTALLLWTILFVLVFLIIRPFSCLYITKVIIIMLRAPCSFSSFLFCVCLLSVSSLTNTSLLRTVCSKCVHLVYLMVYFLFVCFFFDKCFVAKDSMF